MPLPLKAIARPEVRGALDFDRNSPVIQAMPTGRYELFCPNKRCRRKNIVEPGKLGITCQHCKQEINIEYEFSVVPPQPQRERPRSGRVFRMEDEDTN